jgi:hypothetical protein
VRGHDGLAHAEDFKTYVLAFAIAIEPKANNVRAAGCEKRWRERRLGNPRVSKHAMEDLPAWERWSTTRALELASVEMTPAL